MRHMRNLERTVNFLVDIDLRTVRRGTLVVLLLAGFLLPLFRFESISSGSPFPLEETISLRRSTRSFTSENLSEQKLLEILSTAYGYANGNRSTPLIGYDYSLIIFSVNATGSYRYVAEIGLLTIHDLTVNKETIRPHDQDWPSDASVVLVIVWNSTRMDNGFYASAEAGCLVQNMYLAAVSSELGTCCVGNINSSGLRSDLSLSTSLVPLLVMPLGYTTLPYPAASPDYARMTGNLPHVEYGNLTFEDAIANIRTTQNWAIEDLSLQELSQLLWAAYGYSNVSHRTTPSARGIYPLLILVSNATGVYQYIPEDHSVIELLQGNKRFDLANACAGQIWAANAPAIFLVVYNSSYNDGLGDGGVIPHEYIEVDAGAVIQQLVLEASAWNLGVNVVSDGLEEWNGTTAEELREIIGLQSYLVPLYLVPIGVISDEFQGDMNGDGTVDIFDAIILSRAFNSRPGDSNWNQTADINNDEVVDILDAIILANHFGEEQT